MDLGPIKDIDALALDFDGTVCRLFAGYDLQATARRLREGMKRFGVNFLLCQDTFDVFAAIDRQTPPEDGARIWARLAADAVLTEAELDAVEQAAPVKGAENALLRLTLAGVPVGISTNNSAACVRRFLQRRVPELELPVVGRDGAHPDRMKPDPWPVREICRCLDRDPARVLYVGDTVRDLEAARAAGCPFLGMAPVPHARQRLEAVLPPQQIVTDFDELLQRLGLE